MGWVGVYARAVASDLERTGCAKGKSTASCGCMRGGWVGEAGSEGPGKGSRESCSSSSHQSTTNMISHLIPLKKMQEKKEKHALQAGSFVAQRHWGLGGGEGKREGRGREGEKEGGQSTVDEASEHAWGETRGTPSLSITTNKTPSAPPGLSFPRALAR